MKYVRIKAGLLAGVVWVSALVAGAGPLMAEGLKISPFPLDAPRQTLPATEAVRMESAEQRFLQKDALDERGVAPSQPALPAPLVSPQQQAFEAPQDSNRKRNEAIAAVLAPQDILPQAIKVSEIAPASGTQGGEQKVIVIHQYEKQPVQKAPEDQASLAAITRLENQLKNFETSQAQLSATQHHQIAQLQAEKARLEKILAEKLAAEQAQKTVKPSPVRVPVEKTAPRWGAQAGQTVQDVLQNWSNLAHVDFLWATDQTLTLEKPLDISGSYEEAVQALLGQYQGTARQPAAKLYKAPGQPRPVLVVETAHAS